MQLQKNLEAIRGAGIEVVGISYDKPETLKAFAAKSKIAFPLLSDPESKTIDAYHVRNEAAKGPSQGVPHPGTFLLDSEGIVRGKIFFDGFARRHSAEQLIEAAKSSP